MHLECRQFIKNVKELYPEFFRFSRVLEVRSLNINGTVRKHFWFCKYIGLDLHKGRCVDVVCHAADYFKTNYFDPVISCEALEHDEHWIASVWSMYTNLKVGGLMIITCASINRKEHGTTRSEPESSPFTNDYYGNISAVDFEKVLPRQWFSMYSLEQRRNDEDLVFYGIKR